jgi:hypothetical protein
MPAKCINQVVDWFGLDLPETNCPRALDTVIHAFWINSFAPARVRSGRSVKNET